MKTERFTVVDNSKYNYKDDVYDGRDYVFSCRTELAQSIVKLLNAALFQRYEVKRFTFNRTRAEDINSAVHAAVLEEWIAVDEGVLIDRILYCRIGTELRACPPFTWRESAAVLDADKLIEFARLGIETKVMQSAK
jgi:hypothetical protein